jgi:hypothetical protein
VQSDARPTPNGDREIRTYRDAFLSARFSHANHATNRQLDRHGPCHSYLNARREHLGHANACYGARSRD